jgi:hypothetical protein
VIKFVAAGLWLCAVTIGAVFFSFPMSRDGESKEEPAPLLGGLDYVSTPIISVPVLTEHGIVGYFLAKVVYTVEPEKMRKLSTPADALMADQLYTYLYSNPAINFTEVKSLDLEAFRNSIRESVNKRVGDELVHDVIVEQIDFFTKDEIRDKRQRGGKAKIKVPTLPVDPEAKANPDAEKPAQ